MILLWVWVSASDNQCFIVWDVNEVNKQSADYDIKHYTICQETSQVQVKNAQRKTYNGPRQILCSDPHRSTVQIYHRSKDRTQKNSAQLGLGLQPEPISGKILRWHEYWCITMNDHIWVTLIEPRVEFVWRLGIDCSFNQQSLLPSEELRFRSVDSVL